MKSLLIVDYESLRMASEVVKSSHRYGLRALRDALSWSAPLMADVHLDGDDMPQIEIYRSARVDAPTGPFPLADCRPFVLPNCEMTETEQNRVLFAFSEEIWQAVFEEAVALPVLGPLTLSGVFDWRADVVCRIRDPAACRLKLRLAASSSGTFPLAEAVDRAITYLAR